MKVDWQLIRTILREEDTNGWDDSLAYQHIAYCCDAEWLSLTYNKTLDGQYHFNSLSKGMDSLTTEGIDVRDRLSTKQELETVLEIFKSNEIEPYAELLFETLALRARIKLGLVNLNDEEQEA